CFERGVVVDLSWINVVDTAVKIGLGALISAVSGIFVMLKKNDFDNENAVREQFYELRNEKKVKYSEFLSQSQELIQATLYTFYLPNSDEYFRYLRAFNDVQIISEERFRLAAYQVFDEVGKFALLNKQGLSPDLSMRMVNSAREKISILQAIAKTEVTSRYTKT
ncbi:hypothetical protein OCT63_21080, partial [Vibrio sp. RW]|uniref:hypothetical protein n=1 Tax=Vibrio sp. RW TaxID=2998833 RepID=UPI0022CD5AFA